MQRCQYSKKSFSNFQDSLEFTQFPTSSNIFKISKILLRFQVVDFRAVQPIVKDSRSGFTNIQFPIFVDLHRFPNGYVVDFQNFEICEHHILKRFSVDMYLWSAFTYNKGSKVPNLVELWECPKCVKHIGNHFEALISSFEQITNHRNLIINQNCKIMSRGCPDFAHMSLYVSGKRVAFLWQ